MRLTADLHRHRYSTQLIDGGGWMMFVPKPTIPNWSGSEPAVLGYWNSPSACAVCLSAVLNEVYVNKDEGLPRTNPTTTLESRYLPSHPSHLFGISYTVHQADCIRSLGEMKHRKPTGEISAISGIRMETCMEGSFTTYHGYVPWVATPAN